MGTLQEFEALVVERDALVLTHRTERDEANAAYEGEIEAEYRRLYPRRTYLRAKAVKILGPWVDALLASWQPRVKALVEREDAEREAMEDRLWRCAADCPVPVADDRRTVVAHSWTASYHTQGLGAACYARGAVEGAADPARAAGLTVEIHYRKDVLGSVEAWANTTEAGAALLNYKPGPSLREHVRLCWARHVNPRVYHPFLPAGYEEAEGIDSFGHDLRARA
jgi:hypothetical protein